MKQYLHTIMRSLCIMLMLCGISTSAWAQEEPTIAQQWAEALGLTYEEGLGESDGSPFLITKDNWSSFAQNVTMNSVTLSTANLYFKLDGDITIESQLIDQIDACITSSNFNPDGHTISVGTEEKPIEWPVDLYSVFTDSYLDAAITQYHYYVNEDRWSGFSSDINGFEDNLKIYINSSISLSLNDIPAKTITYSNIIFGTDCTITFSGECPEDLSSFQPVFSEESVEANVKYNYTVSSWDAFVTSYRTLSDDYKSNIYFTLDVEEDIVLDSAPEEPFDINSEHLILNGHTISVGENEEGKYATFPEAFKTVFASESDLESGVNYYFSINKSTWDDFTTQYSALAEKENIAFVLGETIELTTDQLSNTPYDKFEKLTWGDYYISVGKEDTPFEYPTSSDFFIFSESDYDKEHVKYYFSVNKEVWDSFVNDYSTLTANENVQFSLAEDVVLSEIPGSPYEMTSDYLKVGDHKVTVGKEDKPAAFTVPTPIFSDETNDLNSAVKYYFKVENGTWDSFASSVPDLSAESTFITLSGDIALADLPSEQISFDNLEAANDLAITVGKESPITFPDTFTELFTTEELNAKVGYYFSVSQDEWDYFTSSVADLDADRINIMLSGDIVVTEMPDCSPIDYTNITLDENGCTIVVNIPLPSELKALFNDTDLESNVTYNYTVTTDEWPNLVANQSYLGEENINITLKGEVAITEFPESPISLTNITADDFSISYGSESGYVDVPEAGFHPIFSDENAELESKIKYYFNAYSGFFENYSDFSKDNVYMKLAEEYTVPANFTQITEFNGHFDGNSDDYSIIMPDCNINNLGTLFSEDIPEENVKNVLYAYSNFYITDAEGLETLRNNASEWDEKDICENFTIDLRNGDIVLGHDWTPIEDSATINYMYNKEGEEGKEKPTHHIIFPSCSVSDIYDISNGHILSSETYSDINECYQYSEITFSSIEEVGYLSSELSSLCNACTNWRLTSNIDNTSETVSSPIAIQGEFVSGEYAILMPGFYASYYPNNLPVIFKGVTGVKYNYSGINIESDNDFEVFIGNQGAMKELSTDVTIKADVYINADNWRPIDKGFVITFTNYIYATIDSQEGLENIAGDLSYLVTNSNYIYVEPNGKDKGDNWYDYDMTSIDLGESFSTIDLQNDLSSSVTILLKDNQSTNNKPFSYSEEKYLNYFYTPSYELIDVLFNNIVTVPENRGIFFTEHTDDSDHAIGKIADFAGHGTVGSPYQIYNYEMLKKFVEIVNAEDNDYTSGMYVKLASDINAQGNERFTDIDGSIMLDDFEEETIQFNNFKGSFDGNKHSIAGLTQPLFYSLDGATVKNLGIVDCNMTGTALATSANNTTVTKSYVSGVSNGLVSEDGNTVEDCYAYNPSLDESNRYTTSSTFNAETVEDISKTHYILKDNCYKLGSKYSDCTLFIPEDNTFYNVSPSNDIFKWDTSDSEDQDTYIYYVNLGSGFVWIDNPIKSNVSMLHNVLYRDGWLNNNTDGYTYNNVGSLRSLDYLYSWYIVDKKNCDVSNLKKYDNYSNELGMCCRVNNIYYSRNSTNTIPKTSAPDGLNTIYLPFAWNPTTDVYDSDGNPMGDDVEVYILADKLSDDQKFSDTEKYKDYSKEKSLLFFDPANKIDATHTTKYDNFAGVSNALPTLLNIPSGKSGWYIKRSGLANYFAQRSDVDYDKDDDDAAGLDNLYNNYWEDTHANSDNQKIGRSFMEIDRLGKDWTNSDINDGSYSQYTRTVHYTCEDKGYGISGCNTKEQIYKTDADKTVCITDNTGNSSDYPIYNINGNIAVDGSDKPLRIYLAYVYGDDKSLTIYKADDDGNLITDEENPDGIALQTTGENDKIYLDDEGYPANIYIGSQKIEITSHDSDQMTGVVSGTGELPDKVVIKDESSNYPAELYNFYTGGNDRIIVDSEGYPTSKITLDRTDPVEITITRNGSSITGRVVSGNEGTLKIGDDVIIEDYNSYYPLSFYVCGGHEEEDTNASWDGSDFPGRAYHLGTFTTIAKETFKDGKLVSDVNYSCYKLNSAGDGFAAVTSNSSVQPFRTFFAIAPGPDTDVQYSNLAKALTFGIVDIADGSNSGATEIDGVPTEGIHLMTTDESKIYSIDGRYVGQYGNKKLAPGMYIMNGKKFVVK